MGKYHDRINWKKELRLLPGYIIVCAWVALTAAILFWIVCASLSSTKEILTGRVVDFSNGLKWDNYVTAWNTQNVSLYFFNSLVYAIVSCVGVLLISAPGAYVLSRWKFVGGKAIRIGLVIAMSVPTIMIIMPLYSLAVRVPYTAIYLLDFFSSLSRSYEEAAYIDGCSHSRTFWQIMLPLVQPAIITVTIFNFMSVWNEFFMALIFTTSDSMTPVGVGLLQIVNAMKYSGQYGAMFAAVIIVFMPTFLLYLFLSEKIIVGATSGGVKG